MNFVNLTPHAIVVRIDGQPDRTFAPSGKVARLAEESTVCENIDGIPRVMTKYTGVVNLPSPVVGTTYIVSGFVAQQCPTRDDVVAPDTGPASVVRDEAGKIVAVRRFLCY